MTDDVLDEALLDVAKKLQKSVDTTNELQRVLKDEKKWRRWAMLFMVVTVFCILIMGLFSIMVLVSVRDCTKPSGDCYKTAVQKEDERRRTTINSSNKLVSDVLKKISDDLNSQLKTLEKNLTTSMTTNR